MLSMSLSELAHLLSVPAPTKDVVFNGLSKDTRSLNPGNLYVAIIGESLDGHAYLEAAKQKGARAALVSHLVTDSDLPQLLVNDTVLALGQLAGTLRARHTLPLVGVTGSNGKTTVKNMIASILRAATTQPETQVLATEGNLNNAIGLPLMLARLTSTHRYGVLEMGMNSFGEIDYLTRMTRPQVTVITNAGESHLQGVENVAGVAKAKGEIFAGLPRDGIAILNRDDAFYTYWCDTLGNKRHISFGLHPEADVRPEALPPTTLSTQPIILHTPFGKMEIQLPLLGQHNILNAAAATAAGLALDLPLTTIKQGLESIIAAPRRMNEILLENGTRLIDDTYNANPLSTQAAIEALARYQGKRILVLGDMRELGPDEIALHTRCGNNAKAAGIEALYTYGELSQNCAKAFGNGAHHFANQVELIAALKPELKANHTLLIKGSNSMKMDNVVKALKNIDSIPTS